MRSLSRLAALAAVTAALAMPATSQVRLTPSAGYDLDVGAPALGLGVEVPLTSTARPFSVAIRPSAGYVFAPDRTVFADPFFSEVPLETGPDDIRLLRTNVDLVGRYHFPGTAFSQYVRAGVVLEHTRASDGSGRSFSSTGEGATLGVGVEYGGLFVEGALGTLNVSTAQVAVGVRF